MHRIITMTALSLALSGGVALADNRGERIEHREARIDHRVDAHRDFHVRPGVRLERREARAGDRWQQHGARWNWQSGRTVRGRR